MNSSSTFTAMPIVFIGCLFVSGCDAQPYTYRAPTAEGDQVTTAEAKSVGISHRKLELLVEQSRSPANSKIDALLLLKNGKLVLEEYSNGYSANKPHDIASITKSVTSLLVGIAIDQGLIDSVNEQVFPYFEGTEYESQWNEKQREITIEHLLTMQHGFDFDDHNDPGMKRFKSWLAEDDWIEALLKVPYQQSPGHKSTYCTASTQLLQQVIERACDKSVQQFANENLFQPIGITDFRWEESAIHGVSMGMGADARPRDLALLGLMVQQGGMWKDQQIVSREWIDQSFRPAGKLLGIDYGYLWYSEDYHHNGENLPSRLAMGHGGQFLVLFPEQDSILIICASDYGQSIDFYELISNFVVPAIL